MEYHVLSNDSMTSIVFQVVFGALMLWYVFVLLGQRDASIANKEKDIIRKVIPYIVLCIFLSELSLLVFRLIDYPWDVEPQPSRASVFSEMRYHGSRYPIWGWANDYQQPILSSLAYCVLWFWWTIYAFNFKPSDISWWKKICKVIAYLILSVTVLGFSLHEFRDILVYVFIIVVVIILLRLAKGKALANEIENKDGEARIISAETSQDCVQEKEDDIRFIPHSSVVQPEDDIDVPQTNEPIVSETVPQEIVVPEQKQIDEAFDKEDEAEFLQYPVITSDNTDKMYCKHCGKRIEADSKFCKYCGGIL